MTERQILERMAAHTRVIASRQGDRQLSLSEWLAHAGESGDRRYRSESICARARLARCLREQRSSRCPASR